VQVGLISVASVGDIKGDIYWIVGEGGGGSSSSWSGFDEATTPWGRKVYQRGDIDWDLERPDGMTNLEAAAEGYAPMRIKDDGMWEEVQLHHLNQDPDGSLAEVWRSTQSKVPHKLQPPPSWRKLYPDKADAFNRERPAYWRWRASRVGK
jgi:hypothetical protein